MSKSRLKKFVQTMEGEFGDGILIIPELGLKTFKDEIKVVSTGSPPIDKILGVGGLPLGRIVEILGSEASGKSTLAMSTVAQAQKNGLRCAYIDVEQSLDRVRAEQVGVNFDSLAISQPENAEQALNLLEFIVVSKDFNIVVLDSVAALVPKAELEGDMTDATIGLQARLMGKILRKIVSPCKKNDVLVIFINQVRHKIGGFSPFPQEVTSGGNALKYYATMRIDMRKTGMTRAKIPKSNHRVRIKKNKLAIPGGDIVVTIGENGFE